MNLTKRYILLFAVVAMILVASCQSAEGDQTGSEYMPDMAHSIAYEANTYLYYYNNTWGGEDKYYDFNLPKEPVTGTVPRGAAGSVLSGNSQGDYNATEIVYKESGSVPYYYEDTEESRTQAIAEIIENPYPITEAGLAKGKELYDVFCGICHGEKGDGAGYLVRDDGGVYPVQPAILNNEEFTAASNGRFYHAIIYGKNLMGGYADKVGYEERWQIIHYIRSLQADTYDKEYNQYLNTLNEVDRPAGDLVNKSITMVEESDAMHAEDDHADGSHGHHESDHDHSHEEDNHDH